MLMYIQLQPLPPQRSVYERDAGHATMAFDFPEWS